MRVYELARELKVPGKTLLAKCMALGIPARNNFSGLAEGEIARLRAAFSPAARAAPPPESGVKKSAPTAEQKTATGADTAAAPRAKETAARPRRGERHREEEPPRPRKRLRLHPLEEDEDESEEEDFSTRGMGLIQATPLQVTQRKRPSRRKREAKRSTRAPAAAPSEVTLSVPISVKDLSAATGVKASRILYHLMQMGLMLNINSTLDAEHVELLAQELGLTIHVRRAASAETLIEQAEQVADRPEDLKPRAPVVAFLGHVDHGKTSLLDRIRQTDVAAKEHGGITQHIGAYRVTIGEKNVVFLDTPGHEAFTAMRARGANVTDIVALVVAADDGVMPQTEEAIDHARAANVPIVVAINKCDKPEADPNRVKQQLAKLGLQPEEWGGDTVCVEVSALTGKGVDDLVEMLALVAELRELKANPNRSATGAVIEAAVSESRGPVATVLIRNGTLRVGDVVVVGSTYGRVKALIDDRGRRVREAGPSTPISVLGLNSLPAAGDKLVVLDDLHKARAVAESRLRQQRETAVTQRRHVTLENLFSSIEAGQVRELKLILKADVRGSLDALDQVVAGISTDEVRIRVLRRSVGGVTTSDVLLADASDAIILGLNVGVDPAARALAEEKGVSVRAYKVIYRVKEEIERALVGMLTPEEREVIGGHAEVRRIFHISRYGNVAGCRVLDGVVARNHRVRLIRDGVVVHDGRIASLRREKDDVREVREGFECGILLDAYNDIKVGDVIESYWVEQVARTLDGAETAPAG